MIQSFKNRPTPLLLPLVTAVAAATLIGCGGSDDNSEQVSPTLVNISNNSTVQGTVFPQVKADPADPKMVAVAWRRYGLPIDTNADINARLADCHVSISHDAGSTFSDTNLMSTLRTVINAGETEPNLYFCNAPWVAFGAGNTVYAGGSMYTPLGTVGPTPKQGRAMLTVSEDAGQSWNAPTYGIKFKDFATGLTGLSNGTAPEDTPWDGSNGFADPNTGVFYSTSGAYVTASQDNGVNFGIVYALNSSAAGMAGWTVSAVGQMNSTHGILGAPFVATASPVVGKTCSVASPCMGYATSADLGKTWAPTFVAQGGEFGTSCESGSRCPASAADFNTNGHVAILTFTPDHSSVKVYYTIDNGATWQSAAPTPALTTPAVVSAGRIGLAYSGDGRIVAVWRGFQQANLLGAFDTFVAALRSGSTTFGATARVSAVSSTYPPLTTQAGCDAITNPQKACYGPTNGGGDFNTSVSASIQYAFIAFPYFPNGIEDTYLARIPLSTLN